VNRVLQVLEAVAMHGPATLDQFMAKIPRKRSSIYRALKDLEAAGWIRRSLNGRTYTISHRMEALANLHFNVSDELTEIIQNLRNIIPRRKVSITILYHIRGDDFAVIDSNLFPLPSGLECEYVKSIMQYLALTFRSSDYHGGLPLRSFPQRNIEYLHLIDEVRKRGYIYFKDHETGVMPLFLPTGESIFIVAEDRNFSATSEARIISIFTEVLNTLSFQGTYTKQETSRQ
jgi:predicted transcriptional regulator